MPALTPQGGLTTASSLHPAKPASAKQAPSCDVHRKVSVGSASPQSKKNKGPTKNIHLVSTLIMHSALKRNNFRRRRDHVEQ
jgi:hypothetical protein